MTSWFNMDTLHVVFDVLLFRCTLLKAGLKSLFIQGGGSFVNGREFYPL